MWFYQFTIISNIFETADDDPHDFVVTFLFFQNVNKKYDILLRKKNKV